MKVVVCILLAWVVGSSEGNDDWECHCQARLDVHLMVPVLLERDHRHRLHPPAPFIADDGPRKVFEIAFEELFIEGKLWDADVKYSFPYGNTNANEDAAGDPVEQAAKGDGMPLRWVERFDSALGLLGLGLLGFIFFAVCSEQDRSSRSRRFAIWSKTNRSYRNKWFELALLAHLVPRVADAHSAYFTIKSGPCTVDPSATNCIRSPNFPSNYGNSQACSITPTSLAIGRPLTATSFFTESGFDTLSIPSHPLGTLTAFVGRSGPSNFILGPGRIQWSTDGSVTYTGWRVCVPPPPPPPPPTPPPPPPTPSPPPPSPAHLVPRVADAQSAYFTITSGPCTVDPSATNCIRSPNFPSNYGDTQACSITPTSLAIGRPLTATSFDTEACCDHLSIPSHPLGTLTGFSAPGPSNFILGPGRIQWSTDGSVTHTGWRVCVSPPPRRPPPPPAPPGAASAATVEQIIQDLHSGSAVAKENAAAALWNLALNADNQVAIAHAGGIAPLVELTRSGSAVAQLNAAAALWNLALNADNRVAIAQAGGIAPLVELTHIGSAGAQEKAAGSF